MNISTDSFIKFGVHSATRWWWIAGDQLFDFNVTKSLTPSKSFYEFPYCEMNFTQQS